MLVCNLGNGNHYMTCMLKISPSNWQRESQIVSEIDNQIYYSFYIKQHRNMQVTCQEEAFRNRL